MVVMRLLVLCGGVEHCVGLTRRVASARSACRKSITRRLLAVGLPALFVRCGSIERRGVYSAVILWVAMLAIIQLIS